MTRTRALFALTATIWAAMSIGAIIVLLAGVTWAAATIVTEALA